ncbi:MAG: hypothetical protein RIB71_18865 [Imperialibacter sp.]|uniref:hypothetical protein n=1 Tax=Imperialibacter sp. TaxID=2038411 RepID=UPI0032EF9B36
MDLQPFKEYRKKIEARMAHVGSRSTSIQEGIKDLADSHKGFQADLNDFMAFVSQGLADHEKRISILERKRRIG